MNENKCLHYTKDAFIMTMNLKTSEPARNVNIFKLILMNESADDQSWGSCYDVDINKSYFFRESPVDPHARLDGIVNQ